MQKLIWLFCCFVMIACNTNRSPRLVWQEEFNYEGLPDTSKWSYDTGGHGWGNNEWQYYSGSDSTTAYVKNGMLHINAYYDTTLQPAFRSARLKTKSKGDWQYGTVEVRAKLPAGRGIWPAIWMLPTDWKYGGWPHSGEIDIMEFVGYVPDSLYGTVHTGSYNHTLETQKGSQIYMPGISDDFQIFKMNWTPDYIEIGVNDTTFFKFDNEQNGSATWPFDQPFHLLVNMAIGGNWGGKNGVDTSIFPQTFLIDYIRVYQ